jgi:YggT family protein
MVVAIFWLVNEVIGLMIWAVIAMAIVSTLISFGVLDTRNRMVYTIEDFLLRVTAPLLNPIRRYMPSFGNVDLSPLIAILLLRALQIVLADVQMHVMLAGLNY